MYICKYLFIDENIYTYTYMHKLFSLLTGFKVQKLGVILHTSFMTVTDLTHLQDEAY